MFGWLFNHRFTFLLVRAKGRRRPWAISKTDFIEISSPIFDNNSCRYFIKRNLILQTKSVIHAYPVKQRKSIGVYASVRMYKSFSLLFATWANVWYDENDAKNEFRQAAFMNCDEYESSVGSFTWIEREKRSYFGHENQNLTNHIRFICRQRVSRFHVRYFKRAWHQNTFDIQSFWE